MRALALLVVLVLAGCSAQTQEPRLVAIRDARMQCIQFGQVLKHIDYLHTDPGTQRFYYRGVCSKGAEVQASGEALHGTAVYIDDRTATNIDIAAGVEAP